MTAVSPHQQQHGVAVLGIFVADLAFRAADLPGVGQTIAGSGFAMGPGGKGSNQSVAAARAGAQVTFISKLGRDAFGANALALWAQEGITPRVPQVTTQPTGAAFIYVHEVTGDNAIIVVPGAAALIDPADVDAAADAISGARVFGTCLRTRSSESCGTSSKPSTLFVRASRYRRRLSARSGLSTPHQATARAAIAGTSRNATAVITPSVPSAPISSWSRL